MIPPKCTGSFCRVVPSLAPGSSSHKPRKCQQEKQHQLCSLGRTPWDISQAFFSLLDTCFSNFRREWYLPTHSSHCTGRERALSYFDKKDHLLALARPYSPHSPGFRVLGWSFIVWLALQMLDPLDSAENSLSGSCQSLDRSADRYGLWG